MTPLKRSIPSMFAQQCKPAFRHRRAWKPALKPVGRSDSGRSFRCALHDKFFSLHMDALYSPQDARRMEERAPAFSFTMKGWRPRRAAEKVGDQSIDLWDGNYCAPAVSERLGLEDKGCLVRAGAAHYNAGTEIGQFGKALEKLAGA